MIKSIVLTEFGETLDGYPDSTYGDEEKLSFCIGVHAVCCGWVDHKNVSQTHAAIICRTCRLRVVIPGNVKTFGDLRQHFKQFNP